MEPFSQEHFKSDSISNLVKAVVHKVKKQKDINRIRYMYLISDLQSIEGVPFDVTEHHGVTYVSVYYYAQQMVEPDVVIIAMDRITSVRIPLHEFYKDLMLKPGPWTQNLDEAPSRLNVERKGAELAQLWSKKVQFTWNGGEVDPAARLYVYKTLLTSEKLLLDLSKDAIGKEALDKLSTIHFMFQSADTIQVENSSGTLYIKVGLSVDLNKLENFLNDQLNKNL
ncbi:MAG: hypothetical protein IT287_05925 [Bdellovibrionaceae bacterium]|nr:hypothetical protein [Pseudobdellovibrionaceae bacterium]